VKGTDERMEAKVAALHALGLLPKGGLTKIQWQVMRALRSDGQLTQKWCEYMDDNHRYFRTATLPVLVQRGLMTEDLRITPDGLILMRHLELEARKRHWERRYR